jgi:uncharacterized small protein (DUF1192 family)
MSGGELGLEQLGSAIGTLSERLDRVEAEGQRRDVALADCVIRLAHRVDELHDRVALLAQVDGVIAGRRVS